MNTIFFYVHDWNICICSCLYVLYVIIYLYGQYTYWIALVPCGELQMLSFTWRYLHSLAYSRYDDACRRRSFPGKNCDNKTICEINEFNRWSFRISLKVTLFKWNKNSSEMTHIVWKYMEWLGLKCNMISTYFIYRNITSWWFQIFSPRALGKMNPCWLIFFKWVGSTSNQDNVEFIPSTFGDRLCHMASGEFTISLVPSA